ncbi:MULTISPECIES: hypothetical protein [Nocardia]|uniref:hypothetical protein n=1 Tax=Nocardia TaxID=1817 RepID=UPI000D692375|nr:MULTISPECIES: hypothetical protein [Nocardia]
MPDRRLSISQTPFTATYVEELADQTGMSKSDVYNQALKVLAMLLNAQRHGVEFVQRDVKSGRTLHDPALPILLGDILTALADREADSPDSIMSD